MTTTSSFRSTCVSSAVALASLRVSVSVMPASLIVSIAPSRAQMGCVLVVNLLDTEPDPSIPRSHELVAHRWMAWRGTGFPGHRKGAAGVHCSRLLGRRQVCKALSQSWRALALVAEQPRRRVLVVR